jgi:hypothetical protein
VLFGADELDDERHLRALHAALTLAEALDGLRLRPSNG